MLTHSAQDFFKADYFFCEGLGDDWLERLTAKGLIVHHPSWISNCVSNGFLMPISKYVLDDLFNPNGIYKDPIFDPKTRTRKDPKPLPACSPPSSSSFSRRGNQKHPFEQSSPVDPYPRKRPRVSYGTDYESITLVQDDENVDTEDEEDDSESLSFDENSPSSKQSMLADLQTKKSNTVFRTPPLSSSRPHSQSSRQRPIISSPMTRDSVNSKASSTRRSDERPCPSAALKHSILQDEEGEMNKPIPDVELKTKHKHKSYFEGKVIRFADPIPKPGSDKHSSSRYPGRGLDLETLDTKLKEAQWYTHFHQLAKLVLRCRL
ncbi:hypothetical protein VKT23_018350 [Stygiomarasmius scandens]|uniref:BRCT domain-containing protein n=1 Tax=Marasmiellus scandens TaxID=2682957 RepID=A0ABR1IRV3_9AGAR